MTDDTAAERQARARRRYDWPVRGFRVGFEPPDDLSASTTPEQRLGMMWGLAVEAWKLAGRAIPTHTRDDLPGRLAQRGRDPG